ncbi:MAG: hypothetical protein WCX64_00255 [Candidatus Micrarchaeia archaeon]|jgi:hypothetical protein
MDRRTEKEEARHRAFIAAPLLGTMIFLIAVVYAVNLSKDEASAVSQIGDDAYHNRLVSMLETYRSDLLSFFQDGLRQNTEDFISSAPWEGINTVEEFSAADRLRKCDAIASVVRGQLISAGVSNQNFLNGFSDLLNEVRKPYVFEGLSFAPVKFDSFEMSTGEGTATWDFTCNCSGTGPCPGRALCERLLPGSTFDCQNYAANLDSPYQCCVDLPASGSSCRVVRGCENGGFYLKVDINDPDVYKAMPRMQISDALGNTVRTSVLGKISFQVSIKYPIYRYNDASFRIFAITQYLNSNAASAPSAPSSKQSVPQIDATTYLEANKESCRYLFSVDKFKQFDFTVTQKGGTITCSNGLVTYSGDLSSENAISFFSIPVTITDKDPRFRVDPDKPNSYSSKHKLSEPS